MGSKLKPGSFDCYGNALPDEPMFIILARDPDFYRLVSEWATRRMQDIQCGLRPESDWQMVIEAQSCAANGAKWRKDNNGKWRAESDYLRQELKKEWWGPRHSWLKQMWPWEWLYFKPKGRRDELICSAALSVAEIERMDRLSSTTVAPKLDPPDSSLTDPSTMGEVE